MINFQAIISIECKVMVPVRMLEDHVNSLHHPLEDDERYSAAGKIFVKDYEQLYWCSEEVPVQGSVSIYHTASNGRINSGISHHIDTGFHVVCIKDARGKYKLHWSCSLS